MDHNFKKGDRVSNPVYGHHYKPNPGTVLNVDELDPNHILVEYDRQPGQTTTVVQKMIGKYLVPLDVAVAKYNEYEQSYQKLSEQLRDKVAGVAEAMHEINKIAKDAGYKISDLSNINEALMNEIDTAGWYTSSARC